MKKHFIYLAALTVALLGCKQEQSELDLNGIQTSATISGYVSYSTGQTEADGSYTNEVQVPAVGKTVYIDIPYSSYTPGATGTKTISTTIDSTGTFTLSVPVPSIGLQGASLRFETFTAEQTLYQRMEDGKPVFEKRMCRFEVEPAPVLPQTLKPEAYIVDDVAYSRVIIDMKDYSETAVFAGTLLLPYEKAYREGAYKKAADCIVEITIVDGEDYETLQADAEQFTYGTATNANGEFSINLPIKNLKKGFRVVSANIVPKAETGFKHYKNPTEVETLKGIYQLREDLALFDVAEVTQGIACNIGTRPLAFIPNYNNGISTPQPNDTWDPDLAGWVVAEEKFADYQNTAVLRGTVALAQETSFGVGTYVTSVQTVSIVGDAFPYDEPFIVPTNADGSFALTIPTKEEGTNPNVNWTVTLDQPAIAYQHYASPTKTITIKEGRYTLYKKQRSAEAAWNELGNFYYTFDPAIPVDTWCDDLAGWVLIEGYDAQQTITAQVNLPYEVSYCVGDYKGLLLRMRLHLVYPDGETATFVAPISNAGLFKVAVPVKDANMTLRADDFTLIDSKTENYKHYYSNREATITGTYNLMQQVEKEDGEWNNKWTLYYAFNPASTLDEPFHSNLAGWQVIPEGWQKTVWNAATIQMPIESSFWKGTYAPLSKSPVEVSYTMDGSSRSMVVLTDANGNVKFDLYRKYGIEEPTINVKVLAKNMTHYYVPGATTTTQIEGTYSQRVKIPTYTDWDKPYTAFMRFAPAASVDRELLSWPTDLVEWIKVENAQMAMVKLYVQKAIETATQNNHEASWDVASNVKAKITIKDAETGLSRTFNRIASNGSFGQFNYPLTHAVAEGDRLYVTIDIDDETKGITAFRHYPDPVQNDNKTLYGNYKYAGNISNTLVEANANRIFDLRQSAKLLFYENGSYSTPAGYAWNVDDEMQ